MLDRESTLKLDIFEEESEETSTNNDKSNG